MRRATANRMASAAYRAGYEHGESSLTADVVLAFDRIGFDVTGPHDASLKVERLLPYLRHSDACARIEQTGIVLCKCGLTELLADIEGEE